jgi:all-trans-retinol 13,14-reductase
MSTGERWDAIVVGGGAGGATAAAYLAAAGRRTLLLEQYDVVGGCSHVFRRKGRWEFDVGIHYLGDCGPGGQIPMLLRGLALDDRIEFTPMDREGFDTVIRPDMEVRVPVGWERYLEELIAAFPSDARGLRRVFGVLSRMGKAVDRSSTPASLWGGARMALDAGAAARWALRPLSSLLSACELSAQATSAISAHCGAYGCPAERAPVAIHASFLENYVGKGAWFPRGGGQVFAAHLVDVIRGHGGTVRTRAAVERILVEGGRAVGVILENGETIRASAVVSGADIKRTYLGMVGREHLRPRTVRRVEGWRMTAPFVNLYLGVDVDLRGRIPNTNYYYAPTVDDPRRLFAEIVDGGARPREEWLADMVANMPAFVHCSTVKDPDNPRVAPAGCSALEVMTEVPAAGALWSRAAGARGGGRDYQRDPEYLELKERLAEMLVSRAEGAIPCVKGKVAWREVSTPLTHERYTRSTDGAAYGLEPNTQQFGPRRPRCTTEIAGLFLAGASLAWGPGIEGSMLSGMHAAGAVMSRDLAREIRAGAVIADPARLSEPTADWDPLLASKRLAAKPMPALV